MNADNTEIQTRGLVFGHPSTPTVSYTVQPSSAGITDAIEIDQGTVAAGSGAVSAVTASMLLYIMNGQIEMVSLVASGAAPTSVAGTSVTSGIFYCKFKVSAIDYANPTNSRFSVSTAGPDGTCGTADDGIAIVTLDASGVPSEQSALDAGSPLTPFAPVRDPNSYAPIGWFDYQGVATPTTEYITYTPNGVSLLDATPSSILSWNGTDVTSQLTLVQYLAPGSPPNIVQVPGTPANCAWSAIGHDVSNFYVACSSNIGLQTFSYAVYQIPYSGLSATLVTSGQNLYVYSGQVGLDSIYLTLTQASAVNLGIPSYSVVAVNKQTFAVTSLGNPTQTVPFVMVTSTGTDFLFQATVFYNQHNPSLFVLDPSLETVAYYADATPAGYVAPTSLNLNLTNNASQLVLFNQPSTDAAGGYGELIDYATNPFNFGNATSIGMPPSTIQGLPVVFLTLDDYGGLVGGGNPNLLLGFALGIPAQQMAPPGSVYSYQTNVAGSLQQTTTAAN